MKFENLTIFLIGDKHYICKLENLFHKRRKYTFENFKHLNY